MRTIFVFVVLEAAVLIFITDGKILDDYIRHYEELNYDHRDLHQRHLRAKRSTTDPNLNLKFKAYGRDFELQLQRDKSIFTPDYKMEHKNGTLEDVDTSFIYSGSVLGVPNSRVHGAVISGIFRGYISIPGDTIYHIEPSLRFFKTRPPFHSVIYSEKYLNLDPYRHKRSAEKRGTCGNDHHREWMEKLSKSAIPRSKRESRTLSENEDGSYHNKYTEKLNKRHKRKTEPFPGNRNTCYLHLRSDPELWKEIYKSYGSNDITRDEILAFFASHVDAINTIYRRTKFQTHDDSISYVGVNFQVQRTSIMTNVTEKCGSPLEETAFCQENIDVSNFLNLNSLTNHDKYCLAFMFTYRDFTMGTLGLAWVGAASKAAGGICEQWKEYPEKNTRTYKSLNTGIVTIVNYGKRVAPKVSQLTFAHEVGHNFGSPHDNGPTCAPYGTSDPSANLGNYIMFASATQGNRPNNDDFSICSKDNITRVLDAVVNENYGKTNCLKVSGSAFCGNGLVEEGEQCDCGFESDCKDNQCCFAKKENEDSPNDCKLKPGAKCSPTQGPCCSSSCQYVQSSAGLVCRAETDCISNATCNGASAVCPASNKKPDMELCNDKSLVCVDGVCSGSLCLRIGHSPESSKTSSWEECFLTSKEDDVAAKEKLCFLACRQNSSTGSDCISSAESDILIKYPEFGNLLKEVDQDKEDGGVYKFQLAAGSPCNNFQGYCDVFHRCRGVDAEGPLQRLKNLIFNPETLTNIKNWIIEYWWAVMLMAIGLVLAMGLFIKFCAVHTPSSNPKAKPAKKLTDTLRRRRRPQTQSPQARYAPGPGPGPSGPPPPYSPHDVPQGGPKQGHRKGKKKGREMELQRV